LLTFGDTLCYDNSAVLTTPDQVSATEKRLALDRALASNTLARSEQLRNILRYVCEREIAGRAAEICEYAIAVEGLGRPEGYSSGEDSSVRNRVFALRKKLDELYLVELAGTDVRIELAKGTYCPRFVKQDEPPSSPLTSPVAPSAAPTGAPSRPEPKPQSVWRAFLAGLAVAGLAASTIFLAFLSPGPAKPDPVLREAWGPLLEPNANVALVVSISPALSVRPYKESPPTYDAIPIVEAPPYLYPWYTQRYPVPPDEKLYLAPTHGPSMGSALAAVSAARLLTRSGASFEMLPETLIPVGATRNRNLILVGTTENSERMRLVLAKTPFDVVYDEEANDYAVAERDGLHRRFASRRDRSGKLIEAYGLLTLLPSEGSDGLRRSVIISGTYSASVSAAMDFFCSSVKMREFREILGREGKRGFPQAYQLVVKASTDHTLPLDYRYQAHRTIP
jgi:hypothetical protein